MVSKIFIDGEAGTTGLQIRDRLAGRRDLEIISIAQDKRKDQEERKRLLNLADVAILCLPDDAAKESVSLIDNDRTKIIDASTAHRVAEGWVYGFAEMDKGQTAKLAAAKRVGNPGCWPSVAISRSSRSRPNAARKRRRAPNSSMPPMSRSCACRMRRRRKAWR